MPTLSVRPRGISTLTITSWAGLQSLESEYQHASPTFASNNWIAANVAIYVPFWTPEPITVTSMWWQNGAAVAGHIDVGVYDEAGNALVTKGSTSQAGTSTMQTVDVTDTVIARGNYYMAMSSDTSGATQKVQAALPILQHPQAFGFLEQTSAFALPTGTATFAKYTRAFWPIFGLVANRGVLI